MKHQVEIDWPGGYGQLATDIGNMQYDSLAEFLRLLAGKIATDAKNDRIQNRVLLATQLEKASRHIEEAWRICKPFVVSNAGKKEKR